MFFQTDPRFPVGIQKEGCDFLSVLGMVERTAKKLFTIQQVIDIYDRSRELQFKNWKGEKHFYIEDNATVQNPDGVCDLACGTIGDMTHTIRQVGRKDPTGKLSFWGLGVEDPKYQVIDFLILHFTTGRGGPHYILADAVGNILFDTYNNPYTRAEYVEAIIYNVQPHEEN